MPVEGALMRRNSRNRFKVTFRVTTQNLNLLKAFLFKLSNQCLKQDFFPVRYAIRSSMSRENYFTLITPPCFDHPDEQKIHNSLDKQEMLFTACSITYQLSSCKDDTQIQLGTNFLCHTFSTLAAQRNQRAFAFISFLGIGWENSV